MTAFSFSSWTVLLKTDHSSEAFKENISLLLLLTGSFPPKPLEIFSSTDAPQTQPSTKSKKVSFFQTLVQNNVKWAQKRKRLLWILTFTWEPQFHIFDTLNAMRTTSLTCTDVAGFVKTSLGSSSRLLKVPNLGYKVKRQWLPWTFFLGLFLSFWSPA